MSYNGNGVISANLDQYAYANVSVSRISDVNNVAFGSGDTVYYHFMDVALLPFNFFVLFRNAVILYFCKSKLHYESIPHYETALCMLESAFKVRRLVFSSKFTIDMFSHLTLLRCLINKNDSRSRVLIAEIIFYMSNNCQFYASDIKGNTLRKFTVDATGLLTPDIDKNISVWIVIY